MKSIILCIAAAAVSCCYTFAQQDANWVFGDSAGLNFHDGITESFTTSMHGYEANASISDSDGNLLFYTNGIKVWNKNHNVMVNGDGLTIGGIPYGAEYGSSYTQGVIILSKPEYNKKYYIFYIQDFGLAYSIIDMSDSLGIIEEKNIEIYDQSLTEKMQAVKHANGCDWWLVLRGWPDVLAGDSSFYFLTYLITASGIEGPFFQYYGEEYEFGEVAGAGQMKFTQDGTMVALTRNTFVDLYDFDRTTGLFSNWKTIQNVFENGAYGLEWSPDNSKLYVSGNYAPPYKTELVQYCFNCKEFLDSTRTLIYKESWDNFVFSQLQIGSDNKIYVSSSYYMDFNSVYEEPNTNLSVINNPNENGLACDFNLLSISLNGRVKLGLPNMPNYNLGALTGSECDTLSTALLTINKKDAINIYPNPASTSFIISGDISFGDEVFMYNATGQLLLQEKIIANQAIDISGMPRGIYVVQLKNNGAIKFADKLVVEKE